MLFRFLLFICLSLHPYMSWSATRFNLESGARWQDYNNVRIPPQGGDSVDLAQGDSNADFHYRAELLWSLTDRHNIRFVYAPLSVSGRQVPGQNINFVAGTFLAGQTIETHYQFNSYRVGYFYDILKGSQDNIQLGVTLKVREARITLSQGLLSQSYPDLGVVPLIYVAYQRSLGENWTLRADLDGAAAPQGRAFDFSVKLHRQIMEKSQIGMGYRGLEGGAENEKVYTFSGFHYWVLDFSLEL